MSVGKLWILDFADGKQIRSLNLIDFDLIPSQSTKPGAISTIASRLCCLAKGSITSLQYKNQECDDDYDTLLVFWSDAGTTCFFFEESRIHSCERTSNCWRHHRRTAKSVRGERCVRIAEENEFFDQMPCRLLGRFSSRLAVCLSVLQLQARWFFDWNKIFHEIHSKRLGESRVVQIQDKHSE